MGSYAKVAMLNTSGAPFGFASLRHISYPTMVLGKSCKLVPVLFMNVRCFFTQTTYDKRS
jgi:UDP-galactose transporter B1